MLILDEAEKDCRGISMTSSVKGLANSMPLTSALQVQRGGVQFEARWSPGIYRPTRSENMTNGATNDITGRNKLQLKQ
jgi:hypothetical protein